MYKTTILKSVQLPTQSADCTYDIIIAFGKILSISKSGENNFPFHHAIIDGEGFYGLPGLIDPHVHTLGGGGGAGYKSYVNGPLVRDFLKAGITSAVGCLGFDSTTRSLAALIRKTKELQSYGMGAKCLIGGFYFPPLTLSNSIREDLLVITEVAGAGELALGDSRASSLHDKDLANYAGECFTGSSLAGKPPILHIHLGEDSKVIKRITQVVNDNYLPISMFHLTHVNRNVDLLEASAEFARKGGMIDVTTHLPVCLPASESVIRLLELGVPHERITVSTDGYGGMQTNTSIWEEYGPSPIDGLLECGMELAQSKMPFDRVMKFISFNAASYYGFWNRGEIKEGNSADILLIDKLSNKLHKVILAGVPYEDFDDEPR